MKYFQISLLFVALLFSSATAFSAEEQEPEEAKKIPSPRYSIEVQRGHKNRGNVEAFRGRMEANNLAARQKKQEIRELLMQLNSIEDPQRKKVVSRIIRDLVAESFDLTTRRREVAIESGEKKLEQARKNLDEAKLSLQRRKKDKEKHIDSFMKTLLSNDPDKVLGLRKKVPEVIPENKQND